MRVDRLLCNLRLCKTRGIAQRLVEEGHLRVDGVRITRCSHDISVGNVLTIPVGREVRIIEILGLPERRGSASEAQSLYRRLDPGGTSALAAESASEPLGNDTK